MREIKLKRVYVAGPYTIGNQILNVRQAVLTGTKLLDLGFAPYIPHLNHFWDFLLLTVFQ